MSLEIKQGLFLFDFVDQHAVLGVPMDAEFKDIRKRYLKIAQRLHPDTCPFTNPGEKEFANQLLSKMVSPAYNKFSNDSERTEYTLLLKTIGKRVVKERNAASLKTDAAKQLMNATGDFLLAYKAALDSLAAKQYEAIDQVLDIMGQISELNVVYILRQEPKAAFSATPAPAPAAAPAPPPDQKASAAAAATKAEPKKDSFIEQSCRRAEEFMASNNHAKAVLELKEVIKKEPNNARCHGLLGMCYLKQNQGTMAKVHIKKALELNPKDPVALEARKELEHPAPAAGAKGKEAAAKTKEAAKGKVPPKSPPASGGKKPDQKGSGGFFGGLFGGGGGKKK